MRKRVIISVSMLVFGLSWMAYNFLVANPIHDQKMKAFNEKSALCDQKMKLLDQATVALDKGDSAASDGLQLQADNIKC
jgi:hypothetical protein